MRSLTYVIVPLVAACSSSGPATSPSAGADQPASPSATAAATATAVATAPVSSAPMPPASAQPSAAASASAASRPAPGKLGAMCGGIAGLRCEDGLVCKMNKPPIPDQSGVCSKP